MTKRICPCGTFFLVFVMCVVAKAPNENKVLEACGNVKLGGAEGERMDNNRPQGKRWYAWGQLYSFCKHRVSARTRDFRCWNDTTCAQCMTVCQAKSEGDRNKVCSSCNNQPCKLGCKFYRLVCKDRRCMEQGNVHVDSATNRSIFDIDKTNLPNVKSNAAIVMSTHDAIHVSWEAVHSSKNATLPSMYLLAVLQHGHIRQNIIGLVEATNFTLHPQDTLCKNIYPYNQKIDVPSYENVSFALMIYPVNVNGPFEQKEALAQKVLIKTQYAAPKPIEPLSNLEVEPGYPKLIDDEEHRTDVDDIYWRVKLPEIHNPYAVGVWYRYEMVPTEYGIKYCTTQRWDHLHELNDKFFKPPYNILLNDSIEIRLHDPLSIEKFDMLRYCNHIISARLIFAHCFITEKFEKKIHYRGCESMQNFSNCTTPTTAPPFLYTYVDPKSIHANADLCNACSPTTFHVDVNWIPYSKRLPVTSYTLHYRMQFESKYRNTSVVLSSKNTSHSLDIRFDSSRYKHGAPLCLLVFAQTPYSNYDVSKIALQDNYEKCLPMPIPDKPVKSFKTTAIAAVAVVGSVGIIALLVKIYRDKRRSILQQQQLNEKINNNVFMKTDAGEILPIIPDEWEVYPDQIDFKKKLGEGAFGTVHSARIDTKIIVNTPYAKQCGGVTLINEKAMVAVKLLKEGVGYGDEENDFRNEIQFMKGIGFHPNIVNLIGCSTIKQPLLLIVEYLPNGDLLRHLRKQRTRYENNLTEKEAEAEPKEDSVSVGDMMSFAWQIAVGMEYLASHNIVHRDLAARNILVGSDKRIKVSDFGLSRQASSVEGLEASEFIYVSKSRRKLPFKWMSLEAIYEREFSTQSDVWSYGVVLFEIVTLGGAPYPLIDNMDHLFRMLKSGYRMERPENCSVELHHIMRHCWNNAPQRRPTFTELREHLEKLMEDKAEYFSLSIDFSKPYYNVASFESLESEDDDVDPLFPNEYYDRPIQLKIVETKTNILDTAIDVDISNEEAATGDKSGAMEIDSSAGVARYISQDSLKSLPEFEKTIASYDNGGFHYSE